MRLLVFNPFGIGDVLFTTPLLRNIKENFPQAYLCFICNRRAYPLIADNVFLDKVFIFEKDEWRALLKASKRKFLNEFFKFFRDIKKEKFDVMFDLSLNSQYGFFFKLTGIKKRIGFNFKKRGRFLTQKIDIPYYKDKHVARYYLDLINFLNINPK